MKRCIHRLAAVDEILLDFMLLHRVVFSKQGCCNGVSDLLPCLVGMNDSPQAAPPLEFFGMKSSSFKDLRNKLYIKSKQL